MENQNELTKVMKERIKEIRIKKGLSQREFADEFSKVIERDAKISVSCVSSWEIGQKRPSYELLIALASFGEVSVEYLLGISDQKNSNRNKAFEMSEYVVEIPAKNLLNYDGKPIFLEVPGEEQKRWGIYNHEERAFHCKTETIPVNNVIRFFAAAPEAWPSHKQQNKRLNYKMFQNASRFWIEYENDDAFIAQKYSGWYRHTEDHSAIINEEGNILPYQAFDIHYKVYSDMPW